MQTMKSEVNLVVINPLHCARTSQKRKPVFKAGLSGEKANKTVLIDIAANDIWGIDSLASTAGPFKG